MDVFRRSGFDFTESPSTSALALSAVPFSRNTTFGAADVAELVGDGPVGDGG